ncbi:MAG: BON domain-containing protein [Hydrogenophaga sp.]|jgi:osmotically-inducible protein OsmY|nr:BON domain-containing protein [Hydrogenophaga sp.]
MNRQPPQTKRFAALIAAAAATALITACGQSEDPTVGQQIDRSIESAQSAANQAGASVQDAARDLQAAGSEAGATVAEGAGDMAITAKVQAAIAADGALSVSDIEIDTEAGRVSLIGTAPDATARDRATSLVTAIEGVVAVDNRLQVRSNS